MAERLLDVSGLKKYYPIKKNLLGKPGAYVKAVNGVDFFINKGETLGLVGESGCGKSTVGKCIIGLEAITEGSITMDGLEISAMKEQERRHIRKDIQMVFQNPYASLNQRRNILQIIDEPMQVNLDLSRTERVARTKELLRMVGLRDDLSFHFPQPLCRQVYQRPDRRDVLGRTCGGCGNGRAVPEPMPSVHEIAAFGDPPCGCKRRGRAAQAGAHHPQGRCAEPRKPAERLLFPHQMPCGQGNLPSGEALPHGSCTRAYRGLPSVQRGGVNA